MITGSGLPDTLPSAHRTEIAYLGELKVKRLNAPKDLQRFQKAYAAAYQRSKRAEQQLSELSQKLKSIDFEQIAEKERARIDLISKRDSANREIGQIGLKINIYEKAIDKRYDLIHEFRERGRTSDGNP